ncbi:MAG: hypothetical protein J6Q54_07705 [Oscillospiraceae bacterium]|nr:hypothetical protein [Oscillospiraceae bacterium]
MNRVTGRAGIVILIALLLVVGIGFFVFEYICEADDWVLFAGSPHIYEDGKMERCVVTDMNNTLLLDMSGERSYSSDSLLRKAFVHWVGDRLGNIDVPTYTNYAEEIVGFDYLNGIYNYGNRAAVVQTTFSAEVQKVALEAMGDYKGTAAVYNYKTGELICAVTTPSYDPDNVPDLSVDAAGAYEGLYFNRFTQAVYTPGSIFKIITLAAALDTIPDIEERKFVCTGSCVIGADVVNCDDIHWDQTLKMAFRNSCNCAFAEIALELGAETLDRYVQQFGVVESVTFDGITTTSGNFEVLDAAQVNVAWASIGQYNDQVNPCAFLKYLGAIAAGGKGALPYFVKQIQIGGSATYTARTQYGDRILSATTIDKIREYMAFNVQDKYGSENFPGMTVCAKTGTAEVGGGKKPNAMLAGFVQDEQYPLAFVVCVEDAGYGKTVCIPIAAEILGACKVVLDR